MLTVAAQRGFSIIELATALTIIGILMALGMPSLSSYLQNARLGTTAKSFFTGVNLARSEAIRTNARVEFVMTNTPIVPGIEATLVPAANGRNWVVRTEATASAPSVLVEAKTALEGAGNANPSVTAVATAPSVTFGSLGNAITPAITISLENPVMGLCVPLGPVRCFNVVVAAGGQTRLCTPDGASAPGDTRRC